MQPENLFPRLPDLSWAKECAHDVLAMLCDIRGDLAQVAERAEKAWYAGFWAGAITASVILLVFVARKRQ